jgi:hypothetical protein
MVSPDAWGFFGHRLINKMAVFTLPPELIGFYKKNMDFFVEHAIDPDKRRYATKHEAVRHYIDIDVWDKIPFPNVPRDFEEAIIKHASIDYVMGTDTVTFRKFMTDDTVFNLVLPWKGDSLRLKMPYRRFVNYWKKVIKPQYYEDVWTVSAYDFNDLFQTQAFDNRNMTILFTDHFSEHGIAPYNLEHMMLRLTKAFESKDYEKILQLSADFGHYIADAHVPLHTTTNYNGQLTDQVGIHAFWESRVPELFAERDYDFFVGQAEYIDDPRSYFWNIITKAHSHLDSVLLVEKRLSRTYSSDQQFCYDERLGSTVRTQCPEYTQAYTDALGDMVEEQMQAAIHAVGSCIFTCWVNAGQPTLRDAPKNIFVSPEPLAPDPNVKTRSHEGGN